MKKVGILTIDDSGNYGNRLQSYALQKYLDSLGIYTVTIKNFKKIYNDNKFIKRNYILIKKKLKRVLLPLVKNNRKYNFYIFEKKYIKYYKTIIYNIVSKNLNKDFDYFITGSDQVWNPFIGRLCDIDILKFTSKEKRISYAASFGVDALPYEYNNAIKLIGTFKSISVREESGKNIIENLTGRKDVEVLVDPTMLLTSEEWDKVSKKPEGIDENEKYILNYFLGNLSEERKKEIEKVAKENNCRIINLLDKNEPLYNSGPSEFLWLEKHAFLICTDSFHSSVFAILYNRPFIIFEREQEEIVNMNSRIDTLINTFKLKNRLYTGKITKENLNHDYTEAYKILEKEREKSKKFLEKALDIK